MKYNKRVAGEIVFSGFFGTLLPIIGDSIYLFKNDINYKIFHLSLIVIGLYIGYVLFVFISNLLQKNSLTFYFSILIVIFMTSSAFILKNNIVENVLRFNLSKVIINETIDLSEFDSINLYNKVEIQTKLYDSDINSFFSRHELYIFFLKLPFIISLIYGVLHFAIILLYFIFGKKIRFKYIDYLFYPISILLLFPLITFYMLNYFDFYDSNYFSIKAVFYSFLSLFFSIIYIGIVSTSIKPYTIYYKEN